MNGRCVMIVAGGVALREEDEFEGLGARVEDAVTKNK